LPKYNSVPHDVWNSLLTGALPRQLDSALINAHGHGGQWERAVAAFDEMKAMVRVRSLMLTPSKPTTTDNCPQPKEALLTVSQL
jgi:pentatricopeptide repeat protein